MGGWVDAIEHKNATNHGAEMKNASRRIIRNQFLLLIGAV